MYWADGSPEVWLQKLPGPSLSIFLPASCIAHPTVHVSASSWTVCSCWTGQRPSQSYLLASELLLPAAEAQGTNRSQGDQYVEALANKTALNLRPLCSWEQLWLCHPKAPGNKGTWKSHCGTRGQPTGLEMALDEERSSISTKWETTRYLQTQEEKHRSPKGESKMWRNSEIAVWEQ